MWQEQSERVGGREEMRAGRSQGRLCRASRAEGRTWAFTPGRGQLWRAVASGAEEVAHTRSLVAASGRMDQRWGPEWRTVQV